MESIRMQGLLHPIILRPKDGTGYLLVAGRHRLEAIRKLHDAGHWTSSAIRAEIVEMDDDAAVLAEIDENLIRADLTPAERAMHIARRKELYEELHPETKQGGAPGKAGGGKDTKPAKLATFAEDTARKTGESRRKVERDATRGKKVKVLADIAGTSLDQGDQLDALAKLSEKEQRDLADRAKAGENVSAKKIVRVRQLADEGKKSRQKPDPDVNVSASGVATLNTPIRHDKVEVKAFADYVREHADFKIIHQSVKEFERTDFNKDIDDIAAWMTKLLDYRKGRFS
jgi:ParB-like chromosome segregation protein Spo0J